MSKNLIAAYSGSGIGLLIGVLMGLAVSPTVGVIIGALSSLLAVLLGLNDEHFSDAKAIRIGSFGFACVLGAFLGIFVRNNNVLAPGLEAQLGMFTEVGYSEEEARDFIAFREFNILNKDWQMVGAPAAGAEADGAATGSIVAQRHASVLFAADVDLSACDELEQTDESMATGDILGNYRITGGFWQSLADATEDRIDREHQKPVLLLAKEVLCANPSLQASDGECAELAGLDAGAGLGDLKGAYGRAGELWAAQAAALEQQPMSDDAQKAALLLWRDCLCEYESQ